MAAVATSWYYVLVLYTDHISEEVNLPKEFVKWCGTKGIKCVQSGQVSIAHVNNLKLQMLLTQVLETGGVLVYRPLPTMQSSYTKIVADQPVMF